MYHTKDPDLDPVVQRIRKRLEIEEFEYISEVDIVRYANEYDLDTQSLISKVSNVWTSEDISARFTRMFDKLETVLSVCRS